jgi:hypothetical protein
MMGYAGVYHPIIQSNEQWVNLETTVLKEQGVNNTSDNLYVFKMYNLI